VNIRFDVSYRQFRNFQIGVISTVIAAYLLALIFTAVTEYGHLLGFFSLLDVGVEQSIPSYVSTLNLLLASLLSIPIYVYEKRTNQSGYGYWLFLSLIFLLLSIDESAGIHEKFENVARYLVLHDYAGPEFASYYWLPFGVMFVAVLFGSMLPFFRRLPTDTLILFIVAGLIFLIGAIGFEYLGLLKTRAAFSNSSLLPNFSILRLVEESLEMIGVLIANCALYREILKRRISFQLGGGAAASAQ